jgi:hypothetical protein
MKKLHILVLALAALLAVGPVVAQNIPAGDDKWDTVGSGSTTVTLSPADWAALCGASVGTNTSVSLKGFNLAGQGTADTIVTRQVALNFAGGATQTSPILLKNLSMVSDGTNPCSPNTLRVTASPTQPVGGTMTVTRTGATGGTFSATVLVSADIVAVNSSGVPVGATITVNGSLSDVSTSPWSYTPPTGGPTGSPWYPSVDPATHATVKTCRRGNKTLPAIHCYQYPPRCGKAAVAASKTAIALNPDNGVTVSVVEHCLEAVPIDQVSPVDGIGVVKD